MAPEEPAEQEPGVSEYLAYLRSAWEEGVASGDYAPLDLEEIKREGRALLKKADD